MISVVPSIIWLGLGASLLVIGARLARQRFRTARTALVVSAAPSQSVEPASDAAPVSAGVLDIARIAAANHQATERLLKLAFAAPSQAAASDIVHGRVRANIIAILQVDTLDPRHFPRRPALMSQLLHAMDEPGAAAEKLSRIVAHDPVLTADVLRLANSSSYRLSPTPIETIQRAIVVCGADALRGMLAAAMLQPVFRASRRNFPRLPRMLWERTERACRAAELYTMRTGPQDRFEAQLAILLSALGPLVVYSATLDVYARNPHFSPSGDLCMELIEAWAPRISLRIARDWQTAPRLQAALEESAMESLAMARHVGEFLGTLSLLESQAVIARDETQELLRTAGAPSIVLEEVWGKMAGYGSAA